MTPVPASRSSLRVLAILPAFNEEDVVGPVVADLIENGLDVYFIDNASTDGTIAAVEPYLGRGVLHIERFPEDAGYSERSRTEYVWRDLLGRIEEIADAHDHDWYVFTNADEFRESPWPGESLRDGIARVDELGFTAINFELFNFRPVDDGFVPGSDPREHLLHYEQAEWFDRLQIKAWKRGPQPAALAPTGGHAADFPGRSLCPVPFILRHYPIRGETHGRRKVFRERMPRFAPEERADGWHVQYDELATGRAEFLHDAAELRVWDGDRVRAELLGRAADTVLLGQALRGLDAAAVPMSPAATESWLARAVGRPVGIDVLQAAAAAIQALPLDDARRYRPDHVEPAAAPLVRAAARALATERVLQGRMPEAAQLAHLAEDLGRRPPRAKSVVGARSLALLALADEVIEEPELLRAYAETFDAEDDATLVLFAPDWDEGDAGRRLAGPVAAAGLDAPGAADVVALAGGAAREDDVAERVDALLSRRVARGALTRLPRYDETSLAGLRAAV